MANFFLAYLDRHLMDDDDDDDDDENDDDDDDDDDDDQQPPGMLPKFLEASSVVSMRFKLELCRNLHNNQK